MKRLIGVFSILIALMLLVSVTGCGDDDDEGTGSTTTTMTSEQTAQQIQYSMEEIGFASVSAALGEATMKWDGWEKPDISGYGKISSEWYDYQNGWHTYHIDTTMTETEDGITTSVTLDLDEQIRFSMNGTYYEEPPEGLDKLEEKTDVEVTASMVDPEYGTTNIGLNADVDATLELQDNDNLMMNMTESFGLTLSTTNPEYGTGNYEYNYSVETTNLVVTPEDYYTCPISGTITMTVSVSYSDGSSTMVGSGTATLVFNDGDVNSTITVGNDQYTETYTNFCNSDYWISSRSYRDLAKAALK